MEEERRGREQIVPVREEGREADSYWLCPSLQHWRFPVASHSYGLLCFSTLDLSPMMYNNSTVWGHCSMRFYFYLHACVSSDMHAGICGDVGTDGCEPPDIGAGSLTQVFWKSRKHS